MLRSTRLYSQEPKENVKRFDFSRLLSKTHASTHFKDPSHREASRLRRALHLKHLDRPKLFFYFASSIDGGDFAESFFLLFLIEIFPAVESQAKSVGADVFAFKMPTMLIIFDHVFLLLLLLVALFCGAYGRLRPSKIVSIPDANVVQLV